MKNNHDITPESVTFRDAGDLIAAVPAMLGFIPENSLVLIAFDSGGSRIGVTMRHDLELDRDGFTTVAMDLMIAELCGVCLDTGTSGVLAIVIDDRFGVEDECWDALFSLVDEGLADVGLGAGFVVTDMALGAPWRARWGAARHHGDGGVLADPRYSPMAVAQAVTTGRVVLPSRDVIVSATTPGPHCSDTACGYDSARPQVESSLPDDAELLRRVLDAVLTGIDVSTPCAQVMILEAAITRLPVRDALLALAVSDLVDAAEALWSELARRLDGGVGRASAATLLGHLHYMRGDGAKAGSALDCALRAYPGHSLARLLDRSLRSGMHPGALGELLPASYAAADTLGVSLPL